MKVLILGKTGMLGQEVYRYLLGRGLDVVGTQRHTPGPDFFAAKGDWLPQLKAVVTSAPYAWVINCLGQTRIPAAPPEAFEAGLMINSIFPHYLASLADEAGFRLLHMSTDSIYGSRGEAFTENDALLGTDAYSRSKALGEVVHQRALNIRCSILGFEAAGKSLLSWFLRQAGPVQGFTNHIWNGVTTLQLAQFFYQLITTNLFQELRAKTSAVNFTVNEPLSKYELLCAIGTVFGHEVEIVPNAASEGVTRILASQFSKDYFSGSLIAIPTALRELKTQARIPS